MFNFVKLKANKKWSLLATKSTDSLNELLLGIRQNQLNQLQYDYLENINEIKSANLLVKLVFLSNAPIIDVDAIYSKYNQPLLISEGGGYSLLKDKLDIAETIESEYFPTDQYYDVVICENNGTPEKFWFDYLTKRFPDMTIGTISNFSTRSEDEIKKFLKNAKFVTFSTTFLNLDWYDKLLKSLTAENKVIGYCHIAEAWSKALEITPNSVNIEIVEKNKL